jgi:hypothetical protein
MAQKLKRAKIKEIDRDGRFIAYEDGIVEDTRTRLMWAARDNGRNINWQNAKDYCENYRGGGYTDWRMPTQDELAGLYHKYKSYRGDRGSFVHVTELIRITACCVWASETHGSRAANFNFYLGNRYCFNQSYSSIYRALPVRVIRYK